MPKIAQRRTSALVIKEPKPQLCKMHNYSGCGEIVMSKHRRGCCDSDYQTLYQMVADRLVSWEELENAEMCLPRRRRTQKRVLTVILARRSA